VKIDVHNHAIPENLIEFFENEPVFGITRAGEYRLGGGPEGEMELTPAFRDGDAKLANLEQHGLDAAIVSINPPFFHYEVEGGAGGALAEAVNEGLRAMCAPRPDRLWWLATVPLQDPHRAAAMLEEQKRLGCVGVEIGTPCITTRPSLGVSSSAIQRSSVVLPEPLGPTMQTTSRSITGRQTRVSTWWSPNFFDTPSATMIGAPAIPPKSSQPARFADAPYGGNSYARSRT